jgi:betaine lipid synthase
LPEGIDVQPIYAGIAIAVLGGACISTYIIKTKKEDENPGLFKSFFLFFYSSFLKPHQGDAKGTQQDALESFYKKQAGAYDATRKVLLRGREDMLALVAAQLNAKAKANSATADKSEKRRIWVDVCCCISSPMVHPAC